MPAPKTLRLEGSMYVRIDRDIDLFLLKLLATMSDESTPPSPQAFTKIVERYRALHPDLDADEIRSRLTLLLSQRMVARHGGAPTLHEEWSLTGHGRALLSR